MDEDEIDFIAEGVRDSLPEGWGICLILVNLNKDPSSIHYRSNVDRPSMVQVLLRFIKGVVQ